MMKTVKTVAAFGVLIVLCLSLVLAGCSKPGQPAGEAKQPAGEAKQPAAEAKYPTGPIRIIMTHAPGGTVDTGTRVIAPFLEKELGVTLVLENMAGAGGAKARTYVANAKPDGYTLLSTTFPSCELGELVTGASYKTMDFTYFGGLTGKNYVVLTVPLSSPVKTFDDLVKISKTKPVTFATSGMGTSDHLAVIAVRNTTGMQAINVPFDSGAAAMTALLGGKVDVQVDNVKGTVPRLKEVRPLVIFAKERSELLPDVPTIIELGYPELVLDTSHSFVGPKGVPEEICKVLEAAFLKVAKDPAFAEACKKTGATPLPLGAKDYREMIQAEYDQLEKAVPDMKADIEQAGKK